MLLTVRATSPWGVLCARHCRGLCPPPPGRPVSAPRSPSRRGGKGGLESVTGALETGEALLSSFYLTVWGWGPRHRGWFTQWLMRLCQGGVNKGSHETHCPAGPETDTHMHCFLCPYTEPQPAPALPLPLPLLPHLSPVGRLVAALRLLNSH